MATKSDIITLPNNHLRTPSKKVKIINDKVKIIIQDMIDATLDWEDSREHEVGVALAAIQIDKPINVIIIRNNFDDKNDRNFQIYINPAITKLEGAIVSDHEGCLSISDIYGKVPRHNKIRLKAQNIDGKEIRIKAEGFLARVFQHEIDHINGKVFIDHIKNNPSAFFKLSKNGNLEELNYDNDIKKNSLLW